MPIECGYGVRLAVGLAVVVTGQAAALPLPQPLLDVRLSLSSRIEKVFDPATDACAPIDMPDISARALRTADGVALFALHYQARALRGPDFDHLKIDCKVALASSEKADPSVYDDRRYLTSLWSADGKHVAALVHNEYHADTHPGRCITPDGLACWWNAVTAMRSDDGAHSFIPATPLIVAAAPFRQEVDQTRHRGFFSPSNMFASGPFVYAFVSTTGWDGQSFGACLIRNRDPMNASDWRGWDGSDFTVQWRDPYGARARSAQAPCTPIAPFGFPVNSVVRHRASGKFIAVWEAPRVEGKFPTAGFYYAFSRNLTEWSLPALLLPGAVIHDACNGGANRDGSVIAYPSLIDPQAQSRNFDDMGDAPYLYFTQITNVGCTAGGARLLVRMRLRAHKAGDDAGYQR